MVTKPVSPRCFLILVLGITLFTVSLIITINTRGLFFETWLSHQLLYQHQLKKIEEAESIDTLFVGDSSLGNAIDAKYYSELSGAHVESLALTGLYGFAGSYNMVKKAYRKGVKKVVLMQSIDMMQRPVAYNGYLLTLGGVDDVLELSSDEVVNLIHAYFDLVFSTRNLKKVLRAMTDSTPERTISNDYINQKGMININRQPDALPPATHNEKLHFLKKLVAFCEEKGIDLIYIQGPILEKTGMGSREYMRRSRNAIASTGIQVIEQPVFIDESHVGDAYDHVAPPFKKQYTKRYFELIEPALPQ